MMRISSLFTALFLVFFFSACSDSNKATVFRVQVENITTATEFTTAAGTPMPIAFSPVVWAVNEDANPFFTPGTPAADKALKQAAEDMDFGLLAAYLVNADGVDLAGIASTTEAKKTILGPGDKFTFLITAPDSAKLSFLTTYLQGNDLFVSAGPDGAALFDSSGNPRTGDITSEFFLYDAGTEVNEAPGLGPNQVLRQSKAGAGQAENQAVQLVNDGFSYPPVSSMLKITIVPTEEVDY